MIVRNGKLQTNIPHKYRYKNCQQNISKSNPSTFFFFKSNIASEVYSQGKDWINIQKWMLTKEQMQFNQESIVFSTNDARTAE